MQIIDEQKSIKDNKIPTIDIESSQSEITASTASSLDLNEDRKVSEVSNDLDDLPPLEKVDTVDRDVKGNVARDDTDVDIYNDDEDDDDSSETEEHKNTYNTRNRGLPPRRRVE